MDPAAHPRVEPGSFRDPDTRVFHQDGAVLRALTDRALADWTSLAATRFFARFSEAGLLIPTRQISAAGDTLPAPPAAAEGWAAVLEHERVPVISYPYEWSFGMLRDAALLQLDLTLAALDEEMTLKDATPFNVQWMGARPTFIDVGSFTTYTPGDPWAGYRQFCETFLYPLLLQAYRNLPFHPWLRGRLEGITAEQCRACLSLRDWLRPGVLAHVVLQAKAQARYERTDGNVRRELRDAGFGAALIRNNVARLRRTVERLAWAPARSTWSGYQDELSYDEAEVDRKQAFVRGVASARHRALAWDIGCNTGVYSRIAAEHSDYVLALDADHLVVDRLYGALKQDAAGREHSAAGRGCRRSLTRPRVAGHGAPAAGGPRAARPHPLPRADAPRRDWPERAARRLRGVARRFRRGGRPGVRRPRRSDGEAAAAQPGRSDDQLFRGCGRCGARALLRCRDARDGRRGTADALPLPADASQRVVALSARARLRQTPAPGYRSCHRARRLALRWRQTPAPPQESCSRTPTRPVQGTTRSLRRSPR